ncbi:MAG: AAA family ATPase [Phycisphaerales bacterium]|nr:AAA family ATPase [Phycisphaerales bacterium]
MAEQDNSEQIKLAAAEEQAPLPPDELRWQCDPAKLPFRSTADVEPVHGVIGQDAAIEALRFGMEINAPGQNVFVRGLTGTGRMTLISRLVNEIRPSCPMARDRCYVHHFPQPAQPRLVTLPRGRGPVFRQRVDELANFIRDDLEPALQSDAFEARRLALEQRVHEKVETVVAPFQQELREADLALVSMQVGPLTQAVLFPLVKGKPVPPEEWEQLKDRGDVTPEFVKHFKERHDAFQQRLRTVMQDVTGFRREHEKTIREMRQEAARGALSLFIDQIVAEFPQPEVREFLQELIEDVVVHRLSAGERDGDDTRHYRVNVVMTHSKGDACEVVVENSPTVGNLLGSVDQRMDGGQGGARSDHLMIRTGSLLRADGGYLVVDARDVLREQGAWKVLVRTLRTGLLEIVPPEFTLPWYAPTLKPEPIAINVKVILLGDHETYFTLDAYDPDFANLFKVLADFDSVIPRNDESINKCAGVLARIVADEQLPHFDASAVAALVEHGARIAERQDKLTTRFGRLADLAREAAFIARKASRATVEAADVRGAVRRSKGRANLPSVRFRELLADGTIRVATTGSEVGQINGIAVIHAGPMVYGFPARITASIGAGSAGVINIEREADLSGAIHTKGFYILGGLLRHLLQTEHPLALHASIAFEQSYGGIDGDSASTAQVCCLLSALTGVPIRQDLAITGAIDQLGHVQAIGSATEKIEGFYVTCRDMGLTGTQGVIIPQSNARDLMLNHEVVDACREGKFHVYAVDTVPQALELLTGVVAGERGEDGAYPEDTLLGLAVNRAFDYWVRANQSFEMAEPSEEASDEQSTEPDDAS